MSKKVERLLDVYSSAPENMKKFITLCRSGEIHPGITEAVKTVLYFARTPLTISEIKEYLELAGCLTKRKQ